MATKGLPENIQDARHIITRIFSLVSDPGLNHDFFFKNRSRHFTTEIDNAGIGFMWEKKGEVNGGNKRENNKREFFDPELKKIETKGRKLSVSKRHRRDYGRNFFMDLSRPSDCF